MGAPGAALVVLFALVTWQVAARGPLLARDVALAARLRSGGLPAGAAELLADLGSVAVVLPVLVLVAGWAGWRARTAGVVRWWAGPASALVLLALVPLLVLPLKAWIARPGPPSMAGTGFYPSGHTATAVVGYGAAVLLLLPRVRGAWPRRWLVVGCLVLNAGVGYGLVRRGYHWPLDVVGSWALCGALLAGLALWWRGRGGPPDG
ncbi:phosphatase PAP2 family protein [Streptomyces sp. NPDC059816]|uniref:phosphatase PAP2 family protein n=1 Tax=Streptomyces sp. NPDC059816 TaxID=3346960 RepID=UPI003652212F